MGQLNGWYKAIVYFAVVFGVAQSYAATPDTTITWSQDVNVSNAGHGVSYPQVVGDGQGNAVVIWVDNTTGDVMSAFSASGTNTWATPVPVSAGPTPKFTPSIAINGNGQGVIVYDNGQPYAGTNLNYLYFRRFSIVGGVFNLSAAVINNYSYTEGPGLVAIDNSGNIYIAALYAASGLGRFYIPAGTSSWSNVYQVDGNMFQRWQGYSPYALAVNLAGQGVVLACDTNALGQSVFLNGANHTTQVLVTGVSSGNNIPTVLAGVGPLGSSVAVENINPNTWQIFFSPMGANTWSSSSTIFNVSNTTGNPPVLSVNQNGIGVLAYNLTTDNYIRTQTVNIPNQQVGLQPMMLGQGANAAISTNSTQNSFAVWVGTSGYLNAAWLPMSYPTWMSSSQMSQHLVEANSNPSIAVTNSNVGVAVYAGATDIYSVFFSVNAAMMAQNVATQSLMESMRIMNPQFTQKGMGM